MSALTGSRTGHMPCRGVEDRRVHYHEQSRAYIRLHDIVMHGFEEVARVAELRLGINLWSQASDWPSFLAAARRADELGYDHVWTWDHVLAIFGDADQPIFEGYTALAALAQATRRVRLGPLVGADTLPNPGLVRPDVAPHDHVR